MRHRLGTSSPLDRMLGSFGLGLIVLLGWACEQNTVESQTYTTRARRALGWLVIESVTAIGWAIDHIAPLEPRDAPRALAFRFNRPGGPRS